MTAIHHVTADQEGQLASTRYRAIIPGAELARDGLSVSIGETPQAGALNIFHKAFNENFPEWIREFGGIFDITDFHFDTPGLGDRYLACADAAQLLTCSSVRLAELVAERTGRFPLFIPDPYEFPEREFKWNGGKSVMWFGHEVNFRTLRGVELDCRLEIVTGCVEPASKVNVKMIPYSHEAMLDAFARNDIVILPQRIDDAKSAAKGANRAVNALRQGKFVVASPIPAYQELQDYIYLTNDATSMLEGIQWAREHQDNARVMVQAGQNYINAHYSPQAAATGWKHVIRTINETQFRLRA